MSWFQQGRLFEQKRRSNIRARFRSLPCRRERGLALQTSKGGVVFRLLSRDFSKIPLFLSNQLPDDGPRHSQVISAQSKQKDQEQRAGKAPPKLQKTCFRCSLNSHARLFQSFPLPFTPQIFTKNNAKVIKERTQQKPREETEWNVSRNTEMYKFDPFCDSFCPSSLTSAPESLIPALISKANYILLSKLAKGNN